MHKGLSIRNVKEETEGSYKCGGEINQQCSHSNLTLVLEFNFGTRVRFINPVPTKAAKAGS